MKSFTLQFTDNDTKKKFKENNEINNNKVFNISIFIH